MSYGVCLSLSDLLHLISKSVHVVANGIVSFLCIAE